VVVEPGDIVGVVLKRSCIDYVNILSFNTTGTGSTHYSYSYTRAGLDSKFNLESDNVIPQKDVIPLIEALVGELAINVKYITAKMLVEHASKLTIGIVVVGTPVWYISPRAV
jgi:hypothetical protein